MSLNYDLNSLSDPVTFTAPSFLAAVGAVLLVGNGQYAADCIDADGEPTNANDVPMFFFEELLNKWLEEHNLTLKGLIVDNRDDIITTLRSFCTGTWQERQLFDLALASITEPEKRKQFLHEWDDRRRSSLNQITNRAHDIADGLAQAAARETAATAADRHAEA